MQTLWQDLRYAARILVKQPSLLILTCATGRRSNPCLKSWRMRWSRAECVRARVSRSAASGCRVSANFFATLGVGPQIGRAFTAAEDQPGGERVMIISHSLWQRRFGGDPGLIGRTIEYNGESYVVIGVMPADFDF